MIEQLNRTELNDRIPKYTNERITELKREIDNSKETHQTHQPKAMHVPELVSDSNKL